MEPYEGVAGILLQVNGKIAWEIEISFRTCVHSQFRGVCLGMKQIQLYLWYALYFLIPLSPTVKQRN